MWTDFWTYFCTQRNPERISSTLLSYPSLRRKLVTWKGNHSFTASATAPSVFVSAIFYRCISQKCQQNIWCKTQCSFALCYYFSCYEILLPPTNWLVEAMAYRLCTRGVNSLLNKTTLRLVHSQVSSWTRLSTIFLLLVFVHFIFVNWNWKLNLAFMIAFLNYFSRYFVFLDHCFSNFFACFVYERSLHDSPVDHENYCWVRMREAPGCWEEFSILTLQRVRKKAILEAKTLMTTKTSVSRMVLLVFHCNVIYSDYVIDLIWWPSPVVLLCTSYTNFNFMVRKKFMEKILSDHDPTVQNQYRWLSLFFSYYGSLCVFNVITVELLLTATSPQRPLLFVLVDTFTLVLTSQWQPSSCDGHFPLSLRWPLWRGSTVT